MKTEELNGTLMNVKDIGFDLRKPCSDCPFRKNAPYHEGILSSLMRYDEAIDDRTFVFSCHKTDPRADYHGKPVKGKIQHCAGALIYQKNTGRLKQNLQLFKAQYLKIFDPKNVRRSKEVFGSFREMLGHYYDGYRNRRGQVDSPQNPGSH